MQSISFFVVSGVVAVEPEFKHLGSGTALCNLTLIVTRGYKGKDGSWVKELSHVPVSLFGKSGETASTLQVGEGVVVSGYVKTNPWKDKDGVEKNFLTLVAEKLICANKAEAPSTSKTTDDAPF